MKAAVISVGTELVLGQVVNTNVAYLAQQLNKFNIELSPQITIPDAQTQLSQMVKKLWKSDDLLFVCGGLGPTNDDLTLASVAKGVGTTLTTDNQYWEQVKSNFRQRQLKISPKNICQAQYLTGGTPLDNPVGLALGSWYEKGGHCVIILPGPPAEFKAMVTHSLLPKLQQSYSATRQISSRTMHFWGKAESQLMDEIDDVTADLGRVVITSYVQPTEIQVRLTVHDEEPSSAKQLLDQAQELILAKEREYYFGVGDQLSLAQVVVDLLREQGLKVTAAESLTGGLFQSTICSIPGASNVFDGGFVTYAARAKEQLLGIDPATIQTHGVVSAPTAAAMATKCKQLLQANIGIGFTGVAGPDSLEGHPAGDVWIGLAFENRPVITKEFHLKAYAGRQAVRTEAVQSGLQMIYQELQK